LYANGFIEFINNRILWTAIIASATAQAMKVLIESVHFRRWDSSLLLSTGGMPSSHSAFVVALAVSVGATHGFNTPLFAVAVGLAIIVMYDAAGVRRAAGKQARVLNMLLDSFVENLEKQGVRIDEKLKELLGHSPFEVFAGALWGIAAAVISYYIYKR
jgi:acid phosphatase family membrane protein YuiD